MLFWTQFDISLFKKAFYGQNPSLMVHYENHSKHPIVVQTRFKREEIFN